MNLFEEGQVVLSAQASCSQQRLNRRGVVTCVNFSAQMPAKRQEAMVKEKKIVQATKAQEAIVAKQKAMLNQETVSTQNFSTSLLRYLCTSCKE
jgi:hypothetical protein